MTLIELLIAVLIVAVLVGFAVQSFSGWTKNMVVRTTADSILSGLQLARAEALKRNTATRFQLVSTLTDACALTTTGPHWVVSLDSAASSCEAAPADPADDASSSSSTGAFGASGAPYIIQKYNGSSASDGKVTIEAPHEEYKFDGMGRLTALSASEFIDIGVRSDATWERYLRIQVMPGGGVRMCNPASSVETQKCPAPPSSSAPSPIP